MKRPSFLLSLLLVVALGFIWVGERVVDSSTSRSMWSGLGVALVLLALAFRFLRSSSAKADDVKRVEQTLLGLQALGLLSVVLYFVQSDVYTRLSGQLFEVGSPKLAVVLAVLWPAVLVASLAPLLLVEMSYFSMARAPKLEVARVREAMLSGFAFAAVLTFAFSMQYVFTERDAKVDLSYFRVAKAGDATKNLVGSLTEPLEVVLFFPPTSDVSTLVDLYFDELKAASPLVSVARYDHALEPSKASEMGVTGNGTLVLRRGARKETIYVGVELEKARTQLSGLDAEVQKRLLQVAKSRRTVYLTAGHGERTQDPLGGADQRATIDILHRTLKDQNFDVRPLSSAEGLANEVPKDAAALFILGPSHPFTEPEARAVEAYALAGGKLFIALDPEAMLPFDELLKPLGLEFKPQTLAHEKLYARITKTTADRVNIGTRVYSSHPSVTYLARYQAGLVMLGAGGLEELSPHAADLVIDFAARSDPDTWNDVNNNLQFDTGTETRKAWGLLTAVSRKGPSGEVQDELRALVLADSDAISDTVIAQVQGNQLLVVDGLKWLLGEEKLAGATNTEADVPLSRSRQQDTAWFYGTTFLAPLLVVGLGFLVRRRGRKAAQPSTRKEAAP